MKLIFLDIDGVCNNKQFFLDFNKSGKKFHPDDMIDPVNVEQLNKIIAGTQAKIVVSSSWRVCRSVEHLQNLLSRHGVIGEVIDKTPDCIQSKSGLWVSKTRGDEIQSWLDDYDQNPEGEDIESFVIIDDESGIHQKENFVQTSMDTGLTEVHVQKAIQILNGRGKEGSNGSNV
jgi:hypothetical protein